MKIRIVFAAVLLLWGCSKTEQQPPSETATTGQFELVADEVLKPVIDSLVQGFLIESPEAKITVKYVSAGEAVRELMNHQARAIIIDRYLTQQECAVMAKDSVSIPDYKMAEDGIGCVVTWPNHLTAIGMSDLHDFFSGHFVRWDQMSDERVKKLGDADGGQREAGVPVTILLPEYPSSIEAVLDSTLSIASDKTAGDVRRVRTDSMITYFGNNGHSWEAIAFMSSAWVHKLQNEGEIGDSDFRILPIIPHDLSSQGISEPVMLHIAYIAEKAYPLTTMVMGYSQEPVNTLPRGFFTYCMTAHGQTTFKNFGILPKTQPIKLTPSTEK